MAQKGKKRPQGRVPKDKRDKPKQVDLAGEGTFKFTLQSGEVIEYKPMNPDLRQAIWDQWPDPEVPTREAKTVDGGLEELPNPDDPDYLEEIVEARRNRAEALVRLLVVQCLADLEPYPENWIEQQRWILPDWEPPEDELELKQYWIEHWLLGPVDMGLLMQAAQLAAVVTPEEVEQQLRSFRPQMAREISERLADTIEQSFAQLRAGDDTGGSVGEDTVAAVPADGEEAPG